MRCNLRNRMVLLESDKRESFNPQVVPKIGIRGERLIASALITEPC